MMILISDLFTEKYKKLHKKFDKIRKNLDDSKKISKETKLELYKDITEIKKT